MLSPNNTYDAVPAPKIVIAVGACAISGGPYIDHQEVHNGADSVVPVDLYVPGCSPHPYTILDGLVSLIGRRRDKARRDQISEEIKSESVRWGTERAEEAARILGGAGKPKPE
jgi:Ni,Fe-hydrogenase III small subunit